MSYSALHSLLVRLFARLNAASTVPSPEELWEEYGHEINQLLELPEIRDEFTDLGNEIHLPKAIEAVRILRNLRQVLMQMQEVIH